MKNLKLFICLLAFFQCLSLYSLDFGLVLDQSADISSPMGGSSEEESDIGYFDYSASLIPRFSSTVGENGNIFISLSAKTEFSIFKGEFTIVPELLRSDFSYNFGSGEFRIGRMTYADPLGFIACGLFDGASVSIDVGGGSVGVGAWYTGFLYKKRANILMTANDYQIYSSAFEFSDFRNTYFAPKRAFFAVEYQNQGLFERAQLRAALLGQFDLSGEGDDKLNSQYAVGKLSVPVNNFIIDSGIAVVMIEYADKNKLAFAGVLGASYMFSWARLSLSGVYSSGVSESGSYTSFTPLTTVYQGNVIDAKLAGLSIVSLDFLGRPLKVFSFGLNASSFIRTDLGTFAYPYPDNPGSGYIAGTELSGRVYWNPVSDIQLNFSGGAFMPSLGNSDPGAATIVRVQLNLVITIY